MAGGEAAEPRKAHSGERAYNRQTYLPGAPLVYRLEHAARVAYGGKRRLGVRQQRPRDLGRKKYAGC